MAHSPALVLNHDAVDKLLPIEACVACTERALTSISSRQVLNPVRWGMVVPLAEKVGTHVVGHMPSYLPDTVTANPDAIQWWHPADSPDGKRGSGGWMASKVVSVFPSNSGTGFSSHQGVVLLFEAGHGSLKCIADAHSITATRTAAASAIATRLLSRPESKVLALLGSGTQAHMHLKAVRIARPGITEVRVWSRKPESAAAFAASYKDLGIPVVAVATSRECVADADIICTVTPSTTPLLAGADVKAGAHINAVGSCFPTQREVDTEAVTRSRLFVDTREACLKEPGCIVTPIKEGAIQEDHIVGEVGQLLLGQIEGRRTPDEVTLFKSVGAAVEDLCAATALFQQASAAPEGSYPTM